MPSNEATPRFVSDANSADNERALDAIAPFNPSPISTANVSPNEIASDELLPSLSTDTVIVEFDNLLFAIEPANLALVILPANIALVIPPAFTLSVSELISIEESSTFTAKLLSPANVPPPDKPSPAVNVKAFKASNSLFRFTNVPEIVLAPNVIVPFA